MSLTTVQQGLIAVDAITPSNLASSGTPTSQTILNGQFGWIFQDSYYFDMGQITVPAGNMVSLLLQTQFIDFNNASIGYDAGSIA